MEFARIVVPAAPVRRKAGHRLEMVSQLLFGEAVKILKQKNELWLKVRSIHDDYEGWITSNLLNEVSEEEAMEKVNNVTSGLIGKAMINGQSIHLPIGASLPGFKEGKIQIGSNSYEYAGDSTNRTDSMNALAPQRIEALTHQWLNVPYCWGGRTIFGVDCSGFVQVNFKMMGIDLPRDAWQQAQEGKAVKKLSDASTGDLAFFDDKDEIVHVGIMLGNDRIIHASGKVRIDQIDKKGIIQTDTGKRTHRLKALRKFC